MDKVFQTVLLLALPASGKSEVRNFMANMDPERLREEFHIGENLQLDDFPYVFFMRRIDEELTAMGRERIFYPANTEPFSDNRDWGTLIHLLSEDYKDLFNRVRVNPKSCAAFLFDRIDRAGAAVGIAPRLSALPGDVREALSDKLDAEAAEIRDSKERQYADDYSGRTLVIEFARGGPDGASMPLTDAHGYIYSLAELSPEILENAVILYIWVTPEESRRKNAAREDPNDPGSNLFHGTPLPVMLGNYGCDDMPYLMERSDVKDTVAVEAYGRTYHVPIGVFDNRVDKTSFLRGEPSEWDSDKVEEVTKGIRAATDIMWAHRSRS